MRRHILMRFPLIWVVLWPSLLGVAAISFPENCRCEQAGRTRNSHLSLMYTRGGREGRILCCLQHARTSSSYLSPLGILFSRMFISICSHPFTSPFFRLGQAPERRSELRGETTQARKADAGLSWDASATILPSTGSFNSICFYREAGRLWCFTGIPNSCHG